MDTDDEMRREADDDTEGSIAVDGTPDSDGDVEGVTDVEANSNADVEADTERETDVEAEFDTKVYLLANAVATNSGDASKGTISTPT